MSYLPPGQTGFFEAVQVYFTEATGRVSVFGARDRALLEQWRDEGRPARVICRGIREAVVSYGKDDPPRSLVQCEGFIDEQWQQFQQRDIGAHDDESDDTGEQSDDELYQRARRAIEQAGKAADEERWRIAYRRAWRRLAETSNPFSFQKLEAVDRALVEAYLDALDDEERHAVEEAIGSVNGGLLRGMSPSARRQHLQAKRKREIIDRFELLDLFEVV